MELNRIGTDIALAAELIRSGQAVGMPTETVYGLAANALDESAVESVFRIKGRPYFDPLIVHVADLESARSAALDWPDEALLLAEIFWPGPLTLVLPRSPEIPDITTSGLPKVGVRCPAHPMALELLKASGCMLAAPSANRFGRTSPTSAQDVLEELGDSVAYVLDGGRCGVGIESTVVEWNAEGHPLILRLGGLSAEKIEKALGRKISSRLSSSRPSAPGMLEAHYSPGVPIKLMRPEQDSEFEPASGFIAYQNASPLISAELQRILSPDGSLDTAATGLFRAMRELGALGLKCIYAEFMPDFGLGPAINDRLRRAAKA